MKTHVAVITLGVRDLALMRAFYADGLGWPIDQEDHNWVFFRLGNGASALALHPWDDSPTTRPCPPRVVVSAV